VRLSDGEKKIEDMFIRFDRIHERDRHTDGRTDKHRMTTCRACIASRSKNDRKYQKKNINFKSHCVRKSAVRGTASITDPEIGTLSVSNRVDYFNSILQRVAAVHLRPLQSVLHG